MSLIAELTLPTNQFELGRILRPDEGELVELETMVPLGQRPVPFFIVHEQFSSTFEERVREHDSVTQVQEIHRHNGERLYKLEWNSSDDSFFEALFEAGAQLLSAKGSDSEWRVEVRFDSHDRLSRFHRRCDEANIRLEVDRIYNPTRPTVGPWYGLTQEQRETFMRAVEGGYYAIPRQMSTQDLADEFGVSDQAVTERLRRAIVTLAENTLFTLPETSETDEE